MTGLLKGNTQRQFTVIAWLLFSPSVVTTIGGFVHPAPTTTAPSAATSSSSVATKQFIGSGLGSGIMTPAAFQTMKTNNRRVESLRNRKWKLYFRDNADEDNGAKEISSLTTPPPSLSKDDSMKAISEINANEINIISKGKEEDEENGETPSGLQFGQWFNSVLKRGESESSEKAKPPPLEIEDTSLLFYDVFLILNLSVSISFWVVHRMSFYDVYPAISEGSLLSILWIVSGLYNGAFLYSAIDGHYDMSKEENAGKGGPKAAGMLGLSTFVRTINLRLIVALITAVVQHRPVGATSGEELIPLEVIFGLVLMSMWRMLHSSYARV